MSQDKPSQDQRNWGTPDPRDGAAYPSPGSTSPAQWAWELLRRKADYRKAWTEIVEPFCDPETGEVDEARVMRAHNAELYMDFEGLLEDGRGASAVCPFRGVAGWQKI